MSLSRHVCMFFAANPDEEMAVSDICAKWDLSPDGNVYACLRTLVDTGYLIGRVDGPRRVYRAGPSIAAALRGTP
jgi:hypothetical protein